MTEKPIQYTTYQELLPAAQIQVKDLIAQRKELLDSYQVTTIQEFRDSLPKPEDAKKMHHIYRKLCRIIAIRKAGEESIEVSIEKVREIFGERFHGPEHIERAFTLSNGEKLITFDSEMRDQATQALQDKLDEPDIKECIQNILAGHIDPNDFMLMLQVRSFDNGETI